MRRVKGWFLLASALLFLTGISFAQETNTQASSSTESIETQASSSTEATETQASSGTASSETQASSGTASSETQASSGTASSETQASSGTEATETQKSSDAGNSPDFGMGMQFGTVTIGGTNYNTIRLQPDLALGKFGIGLDINFEFSGNGDFRFQEWNSVQAVLSKVRYVRWGQKGDVLFVKAGGINDFILGHGILMNRYSNMLNYPAYKKIGLAFDLDLKYFGWETMVANILNPNLFGGRAYVRPLLGLSIPVLNNLEIGATGVVDLNPNGQAPSQDQPYNYEFISPNSSAVVGWGVDAGLPVMNTPVVSMLSYLDVAGIAGRGSGAVLGVAGSLISFIPYQLEFKMIPKGFVTGYFDTYYDADRSSKYESLTNNGYVGWSLSSGVSGFDKKVIWTFQMEDSFGDATKPMLTMNFFLSPDLFKKIGAKFVWMRKNISQFSDVFQFKSKYSLAILDIDYYVSDDMAISIRYTRTYQMVNGNAQKVSSTSVSSKLNF